MSDTPPLDILTVCRRLEARGLIAGASGNVSARRGDVIVATPTGRLKGELEPQELVRLGLDGQPVPGETGRPSSEIAMHLAIYARLERVGAVVHAHPVEATALAFVREEPVDLCVTAEGAAAVGPVARIGWARPGGQELAQWCGRAAAAGAHAILMAHHGVVCVGGSLEEACARMESLEHVARLWWRLRREGITRALPASEVAALRAKAGFVAGLPAAVFEVE